MGKKVLHSHKILFPCRLSVGLFFSWPGAAAPSAPALIRRWLTQAFRLLSKVQLEVERGRWENVDRSLRHCKCCKNDEVEDEYHFVARCSCFNEIRQKFIPIIVNNTNYDTFILLLQATEYVHDIANFIFHATRKRNDILKDCIYYWNTCVRIFKSANVIGQWPKS